MAPLVVDPVSYLNYHHFVGRCPQFPRVPAPIPRSRAISTTGLRVSRTIRTAPALNSEAQLASCV